MPSTAEVEVPVKCPVCQHFLDTLSSRLPVLLSEALLLLDLWHVPNRDELHLESDSAMGTVVFALGDRSASVPMTRMMPESELRVAARLAMRAMRLDPEALVVEMPHA